MCSIQNAAVYRILHLAGFDNRVDGEKVNLQRAAGHGVNTIHVGLSVLQENAAAPGRLHLQCSCVVCGNRWRGQCSRPYNGRAAQEFSTVQSVSHISSQGFLESGDTQWVAKR